MIEQVNFKVGNWNFCWNHKDNKFCGYNETINQIIEGKPEESTCIHYCEKKAEIEARVAALALPEQPASPPGEGL